MGDRSRARSVAFLAGAFLALASVLPAHALTIQATFDSSIVNAPDAADIENTINFATNEISSLYSNPGTVTILFKYSSGSFLGESNSSFYFDTYATVTSELQANLSANPQNTVLATALNNLSSGNDPNGARDIEATSAAFRMGLNDNTATPCFDASGNFVNGCDAVFDGVITLSSTQPIDFTRPVPAYDGTNLQYDGVRVAEHEIDEVLGGGGSGSMLGSPDQSTRYGLLDLYRYSAPGTPSYTGSGIATSYFSIDGGNTNIVGFNQNHNGDYGDWGPNSTPCAGGGSGGPGFVQDAFSCNNVQADVTTSSPEYVMLEAIGYDPVGAPPSGITWDCSTNPDATAHSGSTTAAKTGACTQVILGNNTFTGTTTISAGTLQIGNGGTSGSLGTGNVVDNGVLALDRSDTITFANTISGSGSLLVEGGGTTFLTAANTYSGGTTIAGGSALIMGAGATAGSITGNVVDNGSFYIYRSDQLTFSGAISGAGFLFQAGSGTIILTGANTYSNGTIISAGTLQIGNGGTSGSLGTGNVIDNGALSFDRSNTLSFAGVISGSGSLAQIGSGTTILTGANTYGGGTTISAGTIEAATGAAFGSGKIALNGATILLDNNATVPNEIDINQPSFIDVNGPNTATINGALVGSSPFEKDGEGTLILNHDNRATYSGNISYYGTLVAGVTGAFGTGTVTALDATFVLADGTTDTAATVLNDNLFVIVPAGTAEIAAPITESGGPWGLIKQGDGTLRLSASNGYSGPTTIEGGTLDVLGSIANSTVDVGPGGVLGGAGTVGGIVAANLGSVRPDTPSSVLHVSGSVSFSPGSTYLVPVDAASGAGRIAATGQASLTGGVVSVQAAPGQYAAVSTYPILTSAGGVTGAFDGVTSDLTLLAPTLVYKPSEVDLMLVFSGLDSFARTRNQTAAALAIQGNFAGALFDTFAKLPATAMPAAFDATSGEIHASVLSALLESGETLQQSILEHMRASTFPEAPAAWSHVFGTWGAIGSDGNAATLSTGYSGFLGGIDVPLETGLLAGFDAGYSNMHGFAGARSSAYSAGLAHVGGYAGFEQGPLSVNVGALGSWGTIRTNRTIRFPTFSEAAAARQSAHYVDAFAETAYRANVGDALTLEPFVDANWMEATSDVFRETGGLVALSGASRTQDEPFSTVGLRILGSVRMPAKVELLPTASIGWTHAFHDLTPDRMLTFEQTGESFSIHGVPLDRDQATISAALGTCLFPGAMASIGYEGILGGRIRDNGVRAAVSWQF